MKPWMVFAAADSARVAGSPPGGPAEPSANNTTANNTTNPALPHNAPPSKTSPPNAAETLAESFDKFFSVDLARHQKQKDYAYRIRFDVYCKEFNYEDGEKYADEREVDEFDDDALHCLITHRLSQTPAACVRLVAAGKDDETGPLPLEKYCAGSLDCDFVRQLGLDRNSVCEISRLTVHSRFRRRSHESQSRFGDTGESFTREEQRTFPFVAVASFLGAAALAEVSGRDNIFAMMEPFLPRLMKRSGIVFQLAGENIDYHGQRAPYFITTQTVVSGLKPGLRELYQRIKTQIEQSYQQAGRNNND